MQTPEIDYNTAEAISKGAIHAHFNEIISYYIANPKGSLRYAQPATIKHTPYTLVLDVSGIDDGLVLATRHTMRERGYRAEIYTNPAVLAIVHASNQKLFTDEHGSAPEYAHPGKTASPTQPAKTSPAQPAKTSPEAENARRGLLYMRFYDIINTFTANTCVQSRYEDSSVLLHTPYALALNAEGMGAVVLTTTKHALEEKGYQVAVYTNPSVIYIVHKERTKSYKDANCVTLTYVHPTKAANSGDVVPAAKPSGTDELFLHLVMEFKANPRIEFSAENVAALVVMQAPYTLVLRVKDVSPAVLSVVQAFLQKQGYDTTQYADPAVLVMLSQSKAKEIAGAGGAILVYEHPLRTRIVTCPSATPEGVEPLKSEPITAALAARVAQLEAIVKKQREALSEMRALTAKVDSE
jgi:hypothetical protein